MALTPTPPANRPDPHAAQGESFLREVDDALREDQMVEMAKRYGRPLGAAIVAGLLLFAGYLWWGHSRDEAAGKRSEAFTLALDKLGSGSSAADAALKDLAPLAADGSDGSKAAAAALSASVLLQQGKRDAAIKAFGALAADSGAPQPYRDLATVRQTALQFDTLPPQQVIDRMTPFAVPGNPWFGSAAELSGLAWLQLNKPERAGPLLAAAAKDKTVPESLRSRLRQLAGELGYDGGEDTAVPAAPAAAH